METVYYGRIKFYDTGPRGYWEKIKGTKKRKSYMIGPSFPTAIALWIMALVMTAIAWRAAIR